MKKDEKKLEDKEKENDELMSDLEQLQKEVKIHQICLILKRNK